VRRAPQNRLREDRRIEAVWTVVVLRPKVSRILQEDYIQVLGRKDADDSYDLLTDREREIPQLIAEGEPTKRWRTR
jgi:hypothetical protein